MNSKNKYLILIAAMALILAACTSSTEPKSPFTGYGVSLEWYKNRQERVMEDFYNYPVLVDYYLRLKAEEEARRVQAWHSAYKERERIVESITIDNRPIIAAYVEIMNRSDQEIKQRQAAATRLQLERWRKFYSELNRGQGNNNPR